MLAPDEPHDAGQDDPQIRCPCTRSIPWADISPRSLGSPKADATGPSRFATPRFADAKTVCLRYHLRADCSLNESTTASWADHCLRRRMVHLGHGRRRPTSSASRTRMYPRMRAARARAGSNEAPPFQAVLGPTANDGAPTHSPTLNEPLGPVLTTPPDAASNEVGTAQNRPGTMSAGAVSVPWPVRPSARGRTSDLHRGHAMTHNAQPSLVRDYLDRAMSAGRCSGAWFSSAGITSSWSDTRIS